MRKMNIIIMILALNCVFSHAASPADESSKIIKYLEFREVDIKDVLRQLAKQYNVNIVFSESVKGPVTVQLNNISIDEALDAIITVNGFAYIKKDNIIKVTTPQEAQQEGTMTKLFRLNNANATKLKETLTKVLSEKGSIEADERSNSLVITDAPSVIAKISRMLPLLDKPTRQILIEARFIETSLGTTEKLGIDWNATVSATGASRPTTFPFSRGGEGWPKNYFPSADTSGSKAPSAYAFPYVGDIADTSADVAKGEFLFGTLDFSQLRATLDFLKTKTDARLISSPRVVTMDNKKAEIYIGKTRPIPTFEYNSDTGNYEITGFNEKIEGVTLTVTPSLSKENGDYIIKLKLNPKVSSYIDKVSFANLGFDYPVLSERFVDTEVTIRNGQTIVIGGLITTQKTEVTHKVPFLGDMPLLGSLFSHKETDPNSRSELMIFVTARVLEDTGKPLAGYKSNLITSSPKLFKLDLRNVKARK